jgi:NTE family protein
MGNNNNQFQQQVTTTLVLSGGGAKGAFQAGALEVLRNNGFTFDAISGVSVGSLNGAMLATGQLEELLKVWQDLTPNKILHKNSLLMLFRQYLSYKLGLSDPPVSRYHNKPLQELMKQYLLNKKVNRPFHFGYVVLETGQYVQAVIRHTGEHIIDETDLDRLLASTAIPVYFNPVKIGDATAVDGGLRNISPIRQVLPYQPDRMVIIPTEPVGQDPKSTKVRDIFDIAFRSIEIMLDEIFKEDIDRFLTVNRLVRQAETKDLTLTKSDGTSYKYIKPILIDPAKPLGDALDFDNRRIRKLIARGRERAKEILENQKLAP